MTKNILLFADGTGNEGGLLPDESRTNVYKLHRASRNGPDSSIDPRKQIAFYLHRIGTPTPGQSSRWQKFRQILEQMVGGGLTSRIIDGYAAIVSVWQPGDRIYLFGFSRGAYTVRCLAHVLELFGILAKEPGAEFITAGSTLRLSRWVSCLSGLRILRPWLWIRTRRTLAHGVVIHYPAATAGGCHAEKAPGELPGDPGQRRWVRGGSDREWRSRAHGIWLYD
jgi:hypothetical protein